MKTTFYAFIISTLIGTASCKHYNCTCYGQDPNTHTTTTWTGTAYMETANTSLPPDQLCQNKANIKRKDISWAACTAE